MEGIRVAMKIQAQRPTVMMGFKEDHIPTRLTSS